MRERTREREEREKEKLRGGGGRERIEIHMKIDRERVNREKGRGVFGKKSWADSISEMYIDSFCVAALLLCEQWNA